MKKIAIIGAVLFSIMLGACQKAFLEEKPNRALLVPKTLSDFQAFLDNPTLMNVSPGLNNISSDDFVFSGTLGELVTNMERGSYTWDADVYAGTIAISDWNAPYVQVLNANIILEGWDNLPAPEQQSAAAKQVRGAALFFRGFAFFNLSQQFCAPYAQGTAAQLPGIPIRLSSDLNPISTRGTLQQTYGQIESDLLTAAELLPLQSAYKTRPTRWAAYALLSRMYLAMSSYAAAEEYSNRCLQQNRTLIDYNTLNPAAANPLPPILPNGNPEVLFYALATGYSFPISSATVVSPDLYARYASTDLRKTLYFNDRLNFKGSYNGNRDSFTGLATDELYLIHAECLVRRGEISAGIAELNSLLEKRYQAGRFSPLSAAEETGALQLIFNERRKELINRGIRWGDLRRINQDQRFATTLSRTIGGNTYTLAPQSNRYTFPIPDDEISISKIPQNPR